MSKEKGYEETDVQVKPVAIAGIILFIVVAIIAYLMIPLYHVIKRISEPQSTAATYYVESDVQSPLPMLEVNPNHLRETFFAQQDQLVHSYGWIDAKAGIVRVPVAQAMKRLLAQGVPTREQP